MSAITTFYENLVIRLAVIFPQNDEWHFIPNSYDVGSNPDIILKKGFGVAMLEGNNANRTLCDTLSLDRTVQILISRECPTADNDPTSIPDVVLDLLEDLRTLIADVTMTPIAAGATFDYLSDEGVKPIRGQDYKLLYVAARFRAAFVETL